MSRALAVDPGSQKCGIAIVDWEDPQTPLYLGVVDRESLNDALGSLMKQFAPDRLILGSGSHSKRIRQESAFEWELVDEHGTTLEARKLYFERNPPRGWRKWAPRGLLTPPEPIDAYAAWAMLLRLERITSDEASCHG